MAREDGAALSRAVRGGPAASTRQRSAQFLGRVAVLTALNVAVFVAVRLNDQPGLGVLLYALVPILLGVFWFELPGGLVTATAAVVSFVVDERLSPVLSGSDEFFATVNRAVVFFGVAGLVTWLLRRERALTLRVREQAQDLAELESLRAALTPSDVPARPHLQLATAFSPADGTVGGDFFLVVEGPSDSTTVVVGDVVGHGLEAARTAAFVRAVLSTYARFTSDPAQLLQLADAALAERRGQGVEFITAVCLTISAPPDQLLRWAAAGHHVPWYLDTAAPLPGGRVGRPLGIGVGALDVETGCAVLEPGAGILLFTDGLTEGRPARRGPAGPSEMFGEERARRIVQEHRDAPPARVLEALASTVAAFAKGPLADDLCLVAIRSTPSPLSTSAPSMG